MVSMWQQSLFKEEVSYMKRLVNAISYSIGSGWSETEAELLAHLFAWSAKKYSSNDETMIPINLLEMNEVVSRKAEFCFLCEDLIKEVKDKYTYDSEAMLDQVIKCIIHGLPYNVILECSSSSCANEVRRLMEDSGDYVLSLEVAKHFISSRDIYEFRRVFKILDEVNPLQKKELYEIAKNKGWMVMAAVCEAIQYFDNLESALCEYRKWRKKGLSCYEITEAAIELHRRGLKETEWVTF